MPKFDPMTGEPLQEDPETTQVNVVPQEPKKTSSAKIIIPIVAGVLLLSAIMIGVIASGILMSPKSKVEKAVANTLNDRGYIYDLIASDFSLGDKYTIEASIEAEEEYGDMELEASFALAVKGKEKQLSGVFSYDSEWESIPEIEFISQIDSQKVKLALPSIDSHVFTYNYVEEKEGMIADEVDEEMLEMLDEALAALYSPEETAKDLTDHSASLKAMEKWYKDLKMTKISSEEFEVDDKDRTCKGYELVLTEDDIKDLIDIFSDYYEEKFEDSVLLDYSDYKSVLREMRSDAKGMDDIELRFYVYKNKLAAIEIEMDRDEMQILFKGGDYRMQNIEVIEDRDTIAEIKGRTKDDKETITVYDYDDEIAKISYNRKSGDFKASIEDGWYSYEFSGNIIKKNNEITAKMDEMELGGVIVSGSVSLKKGATISKLKGEEFDIGNADEDELEDLVMDLYEAIY